MNKITVSTIISKPIEHVWDCFNAPKHVMNWNAATSDWHCPAATNALEIGGKFCYTMAAKDGSFSFDFEGTYTHINLHELIHYTMSDGRKVEIIFENTSNGVKVIERFDPETENPIEMQEAGWQMILTNFKNYTESI